MWSKVSCLWILSKNSITNTVCEFQQIIVSVLLDNYKFWNKNNVIKIKDQMRELKKTISAMIMCQNVKGLDFIPGD